MENNLHAQMPFIVSAHLPHLIRCKYPCTETEIKALTAIWLINMIFIPTFVFRGIYDSKSCVSTRDANSIFSNKSSHNMCCEGAGAPNNPIKSGKIESILFLTG